MPLARTSCAPALEEKKKKKRSVILGAADKHDVSPLVILNAYLFTIVLRANTGGGGGGWRFR